MMDTGRENITVTKHECKRTHKGKVIYKYIVDSRLSRPRSRCIVSVLEKRISRGSHIRLQISKKKGFRLENR